MSIFGDVVTIQAPRTVGHLRVFTRTRSGDIAEEFPVVMDTDKAVRGNPGNGSYEPLAKAIKSANGVARWGRTEAGTFGTSARATAVELFVQGHSGVHELQLSLGYGGAGFTSIPGRYQFVALPRGANTPALRSLNTELTTTRFTPSGKPREQSNMPGWPLLDHS